MQILSVEIHRHIDYLSHQIAANPVPFRIQLSGKTLGLSVIAYALLSPGVRSGCNRHPCRPRAMESNPSREQRLTGCEAP